MQEKLTIWIPTKDRPYFLLRVLQYYKKTKFKGCIFIGDSSKGKNLDLNRENIKKFDDSLKAQRILKENIPDSLKSRYVGENGKIRLEIVPFKNLNNQTNKNPARRGPQGRNFKIT